MRVRTLPLGLVGILGILPVFIDPTTGPVKGVAEVHTDVVQDKDPDPDSAKTCAMCHKAIYNEWKVRKHAGAWDDEIYQAKLKKKKRAKMCYACHIPERVLARLGRKPKTRKKNLHEGVNCVACHEKDGKIHGPFGAETDAHKSVKDPLFTDKQSSALCQSCHSTKIDVVLPVGRDFKKANLAAKGKSCAGCHMPKVERHLSVSPVSGKPVGEKRKGRSHKILGPNDAEFCAKAFKLSAKKNGKQLELTIENEAGHRVPGLTIRAFHFFVRQKDGAGKTLSEKKVVVDSENGLQVVESRLFPFDLAAGAVSVEVAIEHHFQDKLVAEISKQTLKL